jgi:hypothetical protein
MSGGSYRRDDADMVRDAGRRAALALAAFQAGDLAVTQLSPRYGAAHLDHLGVPARLRPLLPVVKAGAVVALLVAARGDQRRRSLVGAALVPYYSAATTFHVLSRDPPDAVAPAAGCAALAALLASGATR